MKQKSKVKKEKNEKKSKRKEKRNKVRNKEINYHSFNLYLLYIMPMKICTLILLNN